jgi:hypothetical protein
MEFLILQVEAQDNAGDEWTTWTPVATLEAETGPQAIDQLADKPETVGESLLVAVALGDLTVRQTTIHRHARVHDAAADLTTLAPDLREPATVEG